MKKINAKLPVKVSQKLGKFNRGVAKNSPLLLSIGGVIGLGVTAYLAYKSAGKVSKITDELEKRRIDEKTILAMQEDDLDEAGQQTLEELQTNFKPIKRTEVVRDIAGAVAAPVLVGSLSICSIALSYYILNNRVLNLAASLATATAQNAYFEKKFKKDYGEDEYKKFVEPTTVEEQTYTDSKGKEKTKKVSVANKDMNLGGQWFDQSSEYASDDHAYNMQYIRTQEDILNQKLFRDGFLLLNQVRDALGFDRTRDGALVGWDAGDSFSLSPRITEAVDPTTGEMKPEIFVGWSRPKYIYDSVEYKDLI